MGAVCGAGPARLLLIGGRADELVEYRARCSCGRCIVLGWQSDQQAAILRMQAADILAIPTSRDTLYTRYSFPMKAYDCLALGKPTVVSDVPIIREVMTDAVALAVPAGDGASLAVAVRNLISDRALRERMGAAAREHARQFTWQERARCIVTAVQHP